MDVYRRNPNIAGRVIDGLAFVITPHDNKLQTLNQTATEIWRLAADGCTADAAASAIVELYDDEPWWIVPDHVTYFDRESLAGLLERLGISQPKGVAVAKNFAVVPRSRWESETIRDGDEVEIVRATQGG